MPRKLLSKGQTEAAISDAVTKFEKDYMGRGPLETRTFIIGDMVIVRLKGILTKAELKLSKSEHQARGRDLVKQVRIELIESNRHLLETMIRTITRRKVISLHTDLSTETGERIIVLVLDKPPVFA
ncbi:MAG: DUF2294 family protein [Chitinivibrionales bacterium]|nr:DUF2294 family protein [Chitinivibrionales bacterium]